MRLGVIGGDGRAWWLAVRAQMRGHAVWTMGLKRAGEAACLAPGDALPAADVVALPFPRAITEHGIPCESGHLDAWRVLSQLPMGQAILCGAPGTLLCDMARERGFRLIQPQTSEDYQQKNAVLSAEGAVCALMRESDFAIFKSNCLVVGYGRIGQALCGMLSALGARVTVAARREESREAARRAGHAALPLAQMPALLPGLDALVNTVPALVVGRELLRALPPHAVAVELASPPYGIDLKAARALGVRAVLESGIPGRYAPRDAADILLESLEASDES